jgi:uncharacterized OsmC-like protein
MTQSNTQQQNSQTGAANLVNGVDLEVLGGTADAIRAEPSLGACHFRASNTWVDGARNETRVSGFHGAAQEIAHRKVFTMIADEPPILAGNDDGANPVEHLLHALASCLTTAMVAHAAVRGIRIEAMGCELEGDIDLNGFLGLNPKTPKGYTDIRARFNVDAAEGDIDAIRELASYSPVLNTLVNGVNVDVEVTRK